MTTGFWAKGINDLWISVPVEGDDLYTFRNKTRKHNGKTYSYKSKRIRKNPGHISCKWHQMPKTVYVNKEYPVCKCGRKFIKECYYCKYGNH